MGNEADKKFTWVIKNFSSYRTESVYSDIFVVGGCKWRLLAFPKGYKSYNECLSLYMVVPNHESLPSGWRRHAKFSFKIVNQNPGQNSQLRGDKLRTGLIRRYHTLGFESMIRLYNLNNEFLVNNELKIVAEVDVLEVVGKVDVPVKQLTDIVDVNGFQVLASQVDSVNSLFKNHPNIASNFRAKNPQLRTTYLNILLSLIDILCKSPEKLSNSDLADAYAALRNVIQAGFKLDWLEKELKEAGETRIQDIEEELNGLTQKRAVMDALLKFLK